jgi:putative phosphoesterase
MKVLILSDTHHKVEYQHEVLEFVSDLGIEHIIHAGDLCYEDNLASLKSSGIPYTAVFGNNDANLYELSDRYNIHKEPHELKLAGKSISLMHLPFYLANRSDITIYGHTHEFHSSYKNEKLFLNPGEVCAREKPLIEFLVLEILDEKYIVNRYVRNIHSDSEFKLISEDKYE